MVMAGVELYDRATLVPAICEQLAQGVPMTVACKAVGMKVRTVNLWRENDPEIAAQFDEARDMGYDAIAADCLAIADTPIEGEEIKYDENGSMVERKVGDMLGHRKLRIETRIKLLAKWDPRRYGDRQILAGDKDNPLFQPVTHMSEAQLLAIAARGLKSDATDG
jgi:hypothetical protein